MVDVGTQKSNLVVDVGEEGEEGPLAYFHYLDKVAAVDLHEHCPIALGECEPIFTADMPGWCKWRSLTATLTVVRTICVVVCLSRVLLLEY